MRYFNRFLFHKVDSLIEYYTLCLQNGKTKMPNKHDKLNLRSLQKDNTALNVKTVGRVSLYSQKHLKIVKVSLDCY